MAFPPENSSAMQVCKYLKDVGSATASEIKEATGLSYQTTARAYQEGFMTRLVGKCCNGSYVYSLTPQMRDFLAMGATRYEGAIVPPRTVQFKPWTGKHNLPTDRINAGRTFITLSSAIPASTIPWRP